MATSGRNIVVTGGAGFIGSHACKALHHNGYRPVAVDDLSRGNARAVRWGPLEVADIRDQHAFEAVLERHQPAAVMHFAAFAYVGESVTDPAPYYSRNVTGTLCVLDACRARGVSNLIFSSSCATYGIPTAIPCSELSEQQPINPYGRTKLMCEQAVKDYSAAYGLRYVILRYFNAAGADPEGEIGEWHNPETHLAPRALLAANGDITHLDIFGDDYDTRDGTCVRDYIHVTDLAAGHCAALKHLEGGGPSVCVNLGTGSGISVGEIVKAVEIATGRKVPVRYTPRREGDPPTLVADPAIARALFGFKPAYSGLETIIRTAAAPLGVSLQT